MRTVRPPARLPTQNVPCPLAFACEAGVPRFRTLDPPLAGRRWWIWGWPRAYCGTLEQGNVLFGWWLPNPGSAVGWSPVVDPGFPGKQPPSIAQN